MWEGVVEPGFEAVVERFEAQLLKASGGAALTVYHRGEPVVDVWGGRRNSAGEPWLRDTMALSFSTTKGVASTLLHILVGRGLMAYDDPVAKVWPAFAMEGKGAITLRDVLCHESGLYNIRQMIPDAHHMLDWSKMVRALELAVPVHAPGAGVGYHALIFGFLVGEIIARLTGQRFREALATHLTEPLGIDGAYCGVPERELGRVAELMIDVGKTRRKPDGKPRSDGRARRQRFYARAEKALRVASLGRRTLLDFMNAMAPHGMGEMDFNAPEVLTASMPSANGVFTARSLAQIYNVWALGGRHGDAQLIPSATVRAASTVQNRRSDRVLLMPMEWRLGFHGVMTFGFPPTRAFGHAGFGGSGGWADPERELALGLVINSGQGGSPVGDGRLFEVSRTSMRCADKRSGRRPRALLGMLRR